MIESRSPGCMKSLQKQEEHSWKEQCSQERSRVRGEQSREEQSREEQEEQSSIESRSPVFARCLAKTGGAVTGGAEFD